MRCLLCSKNFVTLSDTFYHKFCNDCIEDQLEYWDLEEDLEYELKQRVEYQIYCDVQEKLAFEKYYETTTTFETLYSDLKL